MTAEIEDRILASCFSYQPWHANHANHANLQKLWHFVCRAHDSTATVAVMVGMVVGWLWDGYGMVVGGVVVVGVGGGGCRWCLHRIFSEGGGVEQPLFSRWSLVLIPLLIRVNPC